MEVGRKGDLAPQHEQGIPSGPEFHFHSGRKCGGFFSFFITDFLRVTLCVFLFSSQKSMQEQQQGTNMASSTEKRLLMSITRTSSTCIDVTVVLL